MSTDVLLPMVLTAGLLDGINPCAFAVMAFLVAFLFAIRRTRWHVLRIGGSYIVGMYLLYFALGLGLMRALSIPGQPHLVARASASFVILLGVIQLKDGLFPQIPVHLSMPSSAWGSIKRLMERTGPLSAAGLGALVGLCTVPCSGGIYLGVLGLLASQVTYLTGVAYLAGYNLMFILPLVGILVLATNRPASRALAGWERSHTKAMHLVAGAAMLGLGAGIFIWTG
ncbi:MAG: cytochrome c biogenesis protein CcdA [Dehalococcoidia bacterium]|nr:cytochrome c biogenesis protein CcdA [Dehalococcoidia bacterium]